MGSLNRETGRSKSMARKYCMLHKLKPVHVVGKMYKILSKRQKTREVGRSKNIEDLRTMSVVLNFTSLGMESHLSLLIGIVSLLLK